MIQYSLEVTICWSLLFLIYICFLKRETFFSINRGYLLSSLIIGLVIPLLRMIDWQWQDDVVLSDSLQFIAAGPNYIATSITPEPMSQEVGLSVLDIVLVAYWIGVLFMSARLIKGVSKIVRLYKQGQKIRKDGFTLVKTNQYHLPFSFLHCVFFSKELALNKDVEHIIKHELTHIKSRHSYDVFFVEILHVLFWWNPLIYLYKKELRQLHEYLADAMVLTGTNQKIYGQILLGQSESGLEIALTHQFFNSHLKQRIMMMYKQKSKRPAMIKYLVALPVVLLLGVLFSFSYSEINKISPEKVKAHMDQYFSEDFEADWQMTKTMRKMVKQYPDHISLITNRFSYEAAQDGISLTFNDDSGQGFCMGNKNITMQAELDELFSVELLKYNSTLFAQRRSEFKQKYADYSDVVEDRFHFEINKRTSSLSQVQVMVTDTIPPPPPPPISPDEIAALIKSPDSKHEIFLDGQEITKQEFLDKEKSIVLRTYTPHEKTDDQFIAPEMYGKIYYRTIDNAEPYLRVEQMPRFPGCEDIVGTHEDKRQCANHEMLKYIYQNIRYPELARKNGVEGVAVVQFVVNTDGSISDINLVRDIGAGAGEAAKQVVESMNEKGLTWTPGVENKNNVRVQFTLPVRFKLEGENANGRGDETLDDPNDELLEEVVVVGFGEKKIKGKGPHEASKREVEGQQLDVFKVVEQMPRFPGCEEMIGDNATKENCAKEKMLQYIYANLNYPEPARKAGVEGMVVVQFVIAKSGILKDIKVVRDIGAGAGEAAKRVVESMNEEGLIWTAGIQKGEKVNVLYTLPVRFKLEGQNMFFENTSEFSLNAFNIPKGSVIVRAEDQKLHEGKDYEIDYQLGRIKILDDSYVKQGLPIRVSFDTPEEKATLPKAKLINEKHNSLGDINSKIEQFRNNRNSPIYKAIQPLRNQFQGSFPLTIINGNKYEGYSVNFGQIDITEDQIRTVNYLEPSVAKNKYGDIAFHGALEIELNNVTEVELEKIGKIITPGSQVLSIREKEEVFKVVEQMPRFPDCEDKCVGVSSIEECHKQELLEFIYAHLRYPQEAKDANIEGMAVVQFIIDKTGTVIEPKVVRDIGGGTAKEVLYVVELMNNLTKKWTPGYQRGKAVNVLYTLPIRFKLEESQINLTSPTSKNPLLIIDGVNKGKSSLKETNHLDPNDIESMHVLKDKKAIDKYGQEGADGVIEIITKSGSSNTIDTPTKFNTKKEATEEFNKEVDLLGELVEEKEASLFGYELMQNKPNPVSEDTVIEFQLPEAAIATIRFNDVQGKTVFEITDQFNKSSNVVKIRKDDLKASGVIYYTLESGTFKATRKMIVLE